MPAKTFCLFLLVLVGCSAAVHVSPGEVPSITFAYSQLLDDACADLAKEPLDSHVVETSRRMLPNLEAAWRKEGPSWLQAAQDTTGRPFSFREARAALITCGLSSMSHPLLINTKRQVRAAELDPARAPQRFVDAVFHELLHRYVSDILNTLGKDSTPLLQKYASEPLFVRNHLHLFAIREAAYAARRRSPDLEDIQSFEASSPFATSFARARDIVQIEGFDRFVNELRPR